MKEENKLFVRVREIGKGVVLQILDKEGNSRKGELGSKIQSGDSIRAVCMFRHLAKQGDTFYMLASSELGKVKEVYRRVLGESLCEEKVLDRIQLEETEGVILVKALPIAEE